MDELVAGLACGAFMASAFVALGSWAVVSMAQNPPWVMRLLLDAYPPFRVVMSIVILSYPILGAVGLALALLYGVAEGAAPGGGIGSPNLFYTLVVGAVTVLAAAPLLILLRPARLQAALCAAVFAGVFGWLLPFLAS